MTEKLLVPTESIKQINECNNELHRLMESWNINASGPDAMKFFQFVEISRKLWLVANTRYEVVAEPKYAQFQNSLEATEFMQNVESQLNDERLDDWAESTDTKAYTLYSDAKAYYKEFLEHMYNC